MFLALALAPLVLRQGPGFDSDLRSFPSLPPLPLISLPTLYCVILKQAKKPPKIFFESDSSKQVNLTAGDTMQGMVDKQRE